MLISSQRLQFSVLRFLCKLYLIFIIFYINILSGSLIRGGRRSSVENAAILAFEHGVRVREEASCRLPKPQVVYVNTTDPSKVYLPRGTLLHRCNDQTGCCSHASQTCQPIRENTVELYFLTVSLQIHHSYNKRVRQQQSFEKLMFTNHTLCGCRLRNTNQDSNDIDDSDNEVWFLSLDKLLILKICKNNVFSHPIIILIYI